MIRRLTLTAGLAVLSAVALTPKAQAQVAQPETEAVPFSGTVGSVCQFKDITPGTLAQRDPRTLESVFDPIAPPTGVPGRTTVNCTNGGEISVSTPTAVNVPSGFSPQDLIAFVFNGNQVADSNGSPPIIVTSDADVPLQVGMSVRANGSLPAGAYEYEVTVTASPN